MKYQQFLIMEKEHSKVDGSEGYKSELTEEKAIEIIKTKCKNVDVNKPLWRGMKYEKDFYLIEGQKGSRKSANTSNHYTLIIDEILKSDFSYAPLRSKSIICSTNQRYASNYGLAYAIFPFDDVEIGQCEYDDIWYTNIYIGGYEETIKDVNSLFKYVSNNPESYEEIVKDIVFDMEHNERDDWEEITLHIADRYIDDHGEDEFEKSDKDDVVEYVLYSMYHPEHALGMKFGTYKELEIDEMEKDDSFEVWFGGKCIAIDMHTYKKMITSGKFEG